MIRTILFDLGNVILPFNLRRLGQRLAPYSSYSPEEIQPRIWKDEVALEFETGRMSPQDFFSTVQRDLKLKDLDFLKFVSIFNDIFEKDEKVLELVKQLRQNHTIAVVSNTNAIHADYVRQTHGNMPGFENLFFSNEMGTRKPEPEFYLAVLKSLQISANESFFIDDTFVNVTAATQLGFQAHHYRGFKQLEEDLEKRGLLNPARSMRTT